MTYFYGLLILPLIYLHMPTYFFHINMSEFDQRFEPREIIGHYGLISWSSDFTLRLYTHLIYNIILSDLD